MRGHTQSFPCSMDRDSHSEDTLSTMVLENIKNKLIHAFRATGESREDPQESGSTVRPVSLGRSFQANEELRRAQIDGAITWLRSELVSSLTDLTFRVFFCSLRSRQFGNAAMYPCASASSNMLIQFFSLLSCSWRCVHRTSSWLRRCWGSTQRSKD